MKLPSFTSLAVILITSTDAFHFQENDEDTSLDKQPPLEANKPEGSPELSPGMSPEVSSEGPSEQQTPASNQVRPHPDDRRVPAITNMFMLIVQERQGVLNTLPMVPIDTIKLANDGIHAGYVDVQASGDPIKQIQTCAYCSNNQEVRCHRHIRSTTSQRSLFEKRFPYSPSPPHAIPHMMRNSAGFFQPENRRRINLYSEDIFGIFLMCSADEEMRKLLT